MSAFSRSLTAAAVAASLCIGTTTAAIAASPTPVAPVQTTAPTASPWLALSAMSSSSAASTAAAQDYDGDGWSVAWPALAVILATIAVAIWIIVDDDDDDGGLDLRPDPVSPA